LRILSNRLNAISAHWTAESPHSIGQAERESSGSQDILEHVRPRHCRRETFLPLVLPHPQPGKVVLTVFCRTILWWGGPHPYHGVLVWSDHIYRWHSPETDNQAFSPSPSSVVAVHGPAFWHTLFPSTLLFIEFIYPDPLLGHHPSNIRLNHLNIKCHQPRLTNHCGKMGGTSCPVARPEARPETSLILSRRGICSSKTS
jgi:hypothetical protein